MTPEQEEIIRNKTETLVRNYFLTWLSVFGFGNAMVVFGGLSYIHFQIPSIVATEAASKGQAAAEQQMRTIIDSVMKPAILDLSKEVARSLSDASRNAGRIEEGVDSIRKLQAIAKVASDEIAGIRTNISELKKEDVVAATELVKAIPKNFSIASLTAEKNELKKEIDNLSAEFAKFQKTISDIVQSMSSNYIEFGAKEKPTQEVTVYFSQMFTKPPKVLIAPNYQSNMPLRYIENIKEITNRHFVLRSDNISPAGYLVHWIAIGEKSK